MYFASRILSEQLGIFLKPQRTFSPQLQCVFISPHIARPHFFTQIPRIPNSHCSLFPNCCAACTAALCSVHSTIPFPNPSTIPPTIQMSIWSHFLCDTLGKFWGTKVLRRMIILFLLIFQF